MADTDVIKNVIKIQECLAKQFPLPEGDDGCNPQRIAVRNALLEVCRLFVDADLADTNFVSKLCSENKARFWQRLSEALFWHQLRQVGLNLFSSVEGRQSGQNVDLARV